MNVSIYEPHLRVTPKDPVGLDSELLAYIGGESLSGEMAMPVNRLGLVVCVLGAKSGAKSQYLQTISHALACRGLGSLVFDPISDREKRWATHVRLDVAKQADRVGALIRLLKNHAATADLPLGILGAERAAEIGFLATENEPDNLAALVLIDAPNPLDWDFAEKNMPPCLAVSYGPKYMRKDRSAAVKIRLDVHRQVIEAPVVSATDTDEEIDAVEVGRLCARWFQYHMLPTEKVTEDSKREGCYLG